MVDLSLRGVGSHFSGSGSSRDAGTILVVVVVVIGLLLALSWIYTKIEAYAERTAIATQQVVLDAHHLLGQGRDADGEPPRHERAD